MMKDFMKKLMNNSWIDKIKKGAQEPKKQAISPFPCAFSLKFSFFHYIYIVRSADCSTGVSANRQWRRTGS